MKDTKDVKITKYLLIFVWACAASTFGVFMGYAAGLPEYYGNIVGTFIIFSITVRIIEMFVPKKKEDEDEDE